MALYVKLDDNNEVEGWFELTGSAVDTTGLTEVSAFPSDYLETRYKYANSTFTEYAGTTEQIATGRRAEREQMFSTTLDRMNRWWADSLTEEQRTEIGIWRQAWLDYPETGVRPEDLEIFNGS